MWSPSIDEPSRLLTIHLFLKVPMQEGVVDIELMHRPVASSGHG